MSLTEATDRMDLYMRLFDRCREFETGQKKTTLDAPMSELAAPPVSLSEIQSNDGSLVTKALEQFGCRNALEKADHFIELSQLISDFEIDLDPNDTHTKRLLDFVYPVV